MHGRCLCSWCSLIQQLGGKQIQKHKVNKNILKHRIWIDKFSPQHWSWSPNQLSDIIITGCITGAALVNAEAENVFLDSYVLQTLWPQFDEALSCFGVYLYVCVCVRRFR